MKFLDPARKVFGIVDADHKLVFIDLCKDENEVWQIYMGWPDASEIRAAKANGFRCVQLKVGLAANQLSKRGRGSRWGRSSGTKRTKNGQQILR